MPLIQLPSSTVKLIGSSQVITTVSSVVKELMENSIDADATNICVKLEKHGLEKIEIKDDGCGISRSDTAYMCLPNYTSKVTDFDDFSNLRSYGFRGEALSSLCAVAQVSITTKTAKDDIAMCYTLDNNGHIRVAKVSQLLKGTIVTVTDLFKCLPVRKQLMSSSRRANEELKKVETVVKSLAVIHPRLRVTLIHNKFIIWQKTSVSNLRQSVIQVIPQSIVKQLHTILYKSELLKMEFLVPKLDCDIASVCTSSASDSCYLFINARPIHDKKIEKGTYQKILQYFGHYVPANKYPTFVGSLTLPQEMLDVNLEPNKTKIFIQNQEQVLNCIDEQLSLYYHRTEENENSEKNYGNSCNKPNKKQKLDLAINNYFGKSINTLKKSSDDLIGFKDSQQINNILSETRVAGLSDQISNNIENQNPVNNILDADVLNTIKESESQGTKPDETISDFLKNEINHSKNKNVDFSEVNNYRLELEDVEMKSSKNNSVTHVLNSLNIQVNSLLDTRSELVEKFVEPLICDKQKWKLFDATPNKEQTSSLDVNISDYNQCSNNCESETSTLSQWSRGEAGLNCSPVRIVKSDGNQEKSTSNPVLSRTSPCSIADHSVASQMGQKEMTAFTRFAREMRSEILQETPGMSFTKVAGQLASKWRDLQEGEKRKYQEEASKLEKEKRDKKLQSITNAKIQQSSFLTVNKSQFQKPFAELEFTLNDLKKINNIPKTTIEGEGFGFLNQLEASPLWVFYNGYDIKVISSLRLWEAVTFHKHLANFKVPLRPFETTVHISLEEIGLNLWNVLMSLEIKNNFIIDSRVTHNGFSIEIIRDPDTKIIITHVALNIKYYGLEDLCELLKIIERHGINCSLTECRPLKVRNFIRSESFRECYGKEAVSDVASMRKLLFYWLENVQPYSEVCLHDHPVAVTLQLPIVCQE